MQEITEGSVWRNVHTGQGSLVLGSWPDHVMVRMGHLRANGQESKARQSISPTSLTPERFLELHEPWGEGGLEAWEVNERAARIILEDRVPSDELRELIRRYAQLDETRRRLPRRRERDRPDESPNY